MSGARFSFVYPTRHRPAFIREALAILALQPRDDVEVVVCDNFVDPELSCAQVCRESGLANLTYVRPPEPVGMVGNWNHSLPFATGEYVCYLTDKMFVLPDAVGRIADALDAAGNPEVIGWISDAWHPDGPPDYFGNGRYWKFPSITGEDPYASYSPAEELSRRGRAEVSRHELGPADYARGKLAFGAYHRDLVSRIVRRHGALFHDINPDYTSMVLGLANAREAIELATSCVVSINADVSNGFLGDTSDVHAYAFLDSMAGGAASVLPNLLVPGLYASQHNWVAHDYLSLRTEFDLAFQFNTANWLTYISEDIYRPERQWSSAQVEAEQKEILRAHLASQDPTLSEAVRARIAERAASPRARPPRHVPFQRTWRRLMGTRPPPPDTSSDPVHFPAASIVAAVEEVAARS